VCVRTSLPDDEKRRSYSSPLTVQIWPPAPRDPTTTKNAHSNSSSNPIMMVQTTMPASMYPTTNHDHNSKRSGEEQGGDNWCRVFWDWFARRGKLEVNADFADAC